MMRRCSTDVDSVPPPRPTPPHPLLSFRTREMHTTTKRDTHHHHQRNRPSSMEASSKVLAPAWTTYSNPLFFENHHHCRRDEEKTADLLKVELERERSLRKKAEAAADSLARDAAEERKKREAAERKAEELEEALKRRVADVGRSRSAANCPVPSPSGAVDDIGREAKQQQQQTQTKKEVENPHIRRGIVGFVEFPRMLRSRRCGKKDGGADTAANLECQKAQFRVLLKSSNRVSPVGSSSPCSSSQKRAAVPSSHHHP